MLRRFLVHRYWNRAFSEGGVRTWAAEPLVRRALNRRVSGSKNVWPVEWLARDVVHEPFPRALSLGCGEGALERDLVMKGLCKEITGLDLSTTALENARQTAREAGHGDQIRYERADLDRLELPEASVEAVFVHQALHHVRGLELCLDAVARALVPGGIFYLDEYVGPSRHVWRRELLEDAEAFYQELPKAIRRRRCLQLPVDWRDPSEAVRSGEIVPLLEERFEIRERRDYGGHLFSVVYPHLDLERLDPAERDGILNLLIAREDELLAAGASSYYTVIVAVPRAHAARSAA